MQPAGLICFCWCTHDECAHDTDEAESGESRLASYRVARPMHKGENDGLDMVHRTASSSARPVCKKVQ